MPLPIAKGTKCSVCEKPTCGCDDCVEARGTLCINCYRIAYTEHSSASIVIKDKPFEHHKISFPTPLSRVKEDAPS